MLQTKMHQICIAGIKLQYKRIVLYSILIITRVEEALSDKVFRVYRTPVDVYCKF